MNRRLQYLFHFQVLCLLVFAVISLASTAVATTTRVLKFDGFPSSYATVVKKSHPYVFEREITLAELDSVVRTLMATGSFAFIDVVEQQNVTRTGEVTQEVIWMLKGQILRKLSSIKIAGHRHFSEAEVLKILGIQTGQPFEKKEFNTNTEILQNAYAKAGYLNPSIDIVTATPGDSDVQIIVNIKEGAQCKISSVVFESINVELSKQAKRIAKKYLTQSMSEENGFSLEKDINEYFAKNRYITTKLSRPAIVLSVDRTQAKLTYVLENPFRHEFLFEGNSFYASGQLIRALDIEKMFGITSSPTPDLAEKLRQFYQANGFAHVNLTYTEKTIEESFRQESHFIIEEGPRVTIKKIEVTGGISRPANYYEKIILRSSSDLVISGYFNQKDIETGSQNLLAELQNQGFLHAKIPSIRSEYSKKKNQITLHVKVEEGPLTQVRQIKIDGLSVFSRAQILDLLKIKIDAPLILKDLEEGLQRIKEFYRSKGYLEMSIRNEGESLVKYNDTNTQATIDLTFHEGPKIQVSSIAVVGNSFTKEFVILREIEFSVGDVLTPEKIEESVYRLQKMGLFSQVEVRTAEQGTEISERTVEIHVGERDPGLVTSGIGITNERDLTYRGYTGFSYRNLGGTGRAVSVRGELKYSSDPVVSFLENKLNIGYLEPYILRGRNRGLVNVTREQKFYDTDADTLKPIIQERNSIAFSIERDLLRHLKLTHTAWSLQNEKRFDRATYENLGTVNIAKMGPSIEYDLRDNAFNPTKGLNAKFEYEYSDPLFGSSDTDKLTVQFMRTTGEITHYKPLTGSHRAIWANSLRGGYLANVSNRHNSGIPDSEAFFLGGRSTIRGFDTTDLERIPNTKQLGVSKLRDFLVTGDSHFYLIKSELTMPIYGNFGFALFYDGGAVYVQQRYVERPTGTTPGVVNIPDPYRDSMGFGFRYDTGVIPIAIDFGFKLDRKSYGIDGEESAGAVHVYIGKF